jgi:adenylate cyclase
MDDETLAALGLYDPTTPDAVERLTLVRLALDHGATVDDIRAALAGSRLHALAADRVLLDQAPRLTLNAAADEADITPAFAGRAWRALGFAVPAPDAVVCTDRDVEVFAFLRDLADALGPDTAITFARATGASLARVADAAVEMVRAGIEAPLRREGASDVDVATQFVGVASTMAPRLYPMFEAVHRRHLVEVARRYSLWGASPTESSTTEAVIGFADLVGYSALNQRLSTSELDELLATFEQRVLDAVARPGARLVKVIGDEAMFAAGTATDALDVATELLDSSDLPALRIGLAAGTVLAREGDLYGTVVNLAARLEVLAEPGQVLLDAVTAGGLAEGTTCPLGPRAVDGFADPVEVFSLVR